MADKDITTSIEADDSDVVSLKKDHYAETGGKTSLAPPSRVPEQPKTLNAELLNMLKLGKKFAQFQGIDRCIRVIEPGTPNQRHCLAMMVKNLTMNAQMCSNCDRVRDVNANPKIINSSMIRLSHKELEECGLSSDPLLNAKSQPVEQPKSRQKPAKVAEPKLRRPKVAVPKTVKIEMTMEDLKKDPNVLRIMLLKTLDAIFELPVSNFREAEEIRVVKERVDAALNQFPSEAK